MTTSHIFVSHSYGMTYNDFLDLERNPEGRHSTMDQKLKGLVENIRNSANCYVIENKIVNQLTWNAVAEKRGLKNAASFL